MNNQNDRVLRYKQTGDIRLECSLVLNRLFHDPKQRRDFEKDWPEFLESHEYNKEVYSLKRNT